MFKLQYHPRALKFLQKIPAKQAERILKKMEVLQNDIHATQLNISSLVGTANSFRLRVGDIRIVYEISLELKIIYIQDIDFRGGIYK